MANRHERRKAARHLYATVQGRQRTHSTNGRLKMVTAQERQRISGLIDAGAANGDSVEAIAKAIAREMPHLKAADIANVSRVRSEMLRQDAAVYMAQAQTSSRVADILDLIGAPNVGAALDMLVARKAQGDVAAAELLEELHQALSVATMPDE
jgi:hypothetical protein